MRTVNLNSVDLADRKVRFIAIRSTGQLLIPDSPDCEEDAIPLFLGTDVLDCSVDPNMMKNGVRIHARYAKEGKASKIQFKDCRIEGINHSKSLWAYSIQGVFQVVFSLNNLDMQKDCLLKLRDIWLKYYDRPMLEETTSVFIGDSFTCDPENSAGKLVGRRQDSSEGENLELKCHHQNSYTSINSKKTSEEETQTTCHSSISTRDGAQKLKPGQHMCINREVSPRESMTQTDSIFRSESKLVCIVEKNFPTLVKHTSTQTDAASFEVQNNESLNKSDGQLVEQICSQQKKEDQGKCPKSGEKMEEDQGTCQKYGEEIRNSVQGKKKVIVIVGRNVRVTSGVESRETEKRKVIEGQSEEMSKLDYNEGNIYTPTARCDVCQKYQQQSEQSCTDQRQRQQTLQSLEDIIENTASYLQQTYSKEKESLIELVSLLMKLLCLEAESEHLGFDFNIFRLYVQQIETFNTDEQYPFDEFGISWKKSLFLTIICRYLGQVLHGIGDIVIEKVKKFKREHISNIGNLPPPEVITDRVFPKFMMSLIEVWMGKQSTSETKVIEMTFLDEHNYGYKRLKRDTMASDRMPSNALIQLILELTNNALISPMAHVVVAAVK